MKSTKQLLNLLFVIGLDCIGVAQAARHATAVESLNIGSDIFEEGAVISMASGRHGFPGNYKYEFREEQTATFWNFDYKDVTASWRAFAVIPYDGKLTFLKKLCHDWQVIAQQPENWKEFGYTGVEAINWHSDAVDYLMKKLQTNPTTKFSWLEKVVLYAVSANLDVFTHKNH
jgi:hypothetical protein